MTEDRTPDPPEDAVTCDDGAEEAAAAEAAEAAEREFVRDLEERGEVVDEGADLPPGATHERVKTGDGKPPKVRRRRYTIT